MILPMSHKHDVASARRAAAEDRLLEWILDYLRQPSWANRSLAAILTGQRPILRGPIKVPLSELRRIAGPEEGIRYRKDPEVWAREISAITESCGHPDELPPILVRLVEGRYELSDGNHRLAALTELGATEAWAIVWHDREPRWQGWWNPFPPGEVPKVEVAIGAARDRAVAFYQEHVRGMPPAKDEILLTAELHGQVVGAVRLAPEAEGWTLRTMLVLPEHPGLRLGAWMLHRLKAEMEGKRVHCLAYPHLRRFYGEVGFEAIPPEELPPLLYERFLSYQDDRGCLPLRRLPVALQREPL